MKIIKNNYIKYTICITLLYIILFLLVSIFENTKTTYSSLTKEIEKRTITKTTEEYNILAHYPSFNNENINKEIKDYIYNYINTFIESKGTNLTINYEIHFTDSTLNIFFTIENSLNKTTYYKSFNYNLNTLEQIVKINNEEKLKEYISKKYSHHISTTIASLPKEDYAIKTTNQGTHYYFNYDLFENIDYTPEIYLDTTGNIILETKEKKYSIAFTFDDGPSEYTNDFVETLKLNNATATFFMLGNRMKYNQSTVLNVYNNGMEIGSHSYSHKNLHKISNKEIEEEVNSTTIIFNEITNDQIKLFRAPYGNAKESVRKLIPFPVISWNIDPEDWLYRDANKTYNHIIENACDGCIVLMHDLYPETLEAIKMAIPKLQEMGYNITSISNLAEQKEITLLEGNIYRTFNNYNLPF